MKLFFSRPLLLLSLLSLLPLVYYWLKTPTSLTPSRSRASLWLRGLGLTCLGLAMAGASVVSSSNDLTVIFLLDRSYSTGGNSQGWQRSFLNEALQGKSGGDQFGVVVFGKDTGVELPAGNHGSEVGPLTTVVDQRASGLTSAQPPPINVCCMVIPQDISASMCMDRRGWCVYSRSRYSSPRC